MDFASESDREQFQRRLEETITWCSSQDWSFQPQPRRTPAWGPPTDYHQIMDVIAWVAAQGQPIPPGKGLRTELLRPPEIIENTQAIFARRPPLAHAELMAVENAEILRQWREETARLLAIENAETNRQWQRNVEQLTAKRAALLQAQHAPIGQVALPLTHGRLLAYFHGRSTGEGAAEAATDGFFDWDNRPAWDTWLVYVPDDSLLLSWIPDALVEVAEAGMDVAWEGCIRWAADLDTTSIRQLKQAGFIR